MSKNKKTTGIIDFSKALEIMKRCGRVARKAWQEYEPDSYILLCQTQREDGTMERWFCHCRVFSLFATSWNPTSDEILAEGWFEVTVLTCDNTKFA